MARRTLYVEVGGIYDSPLMQRLYMLLNAGVRDTDGDPVSILTRLLNRTKAIPTHIRIESNKLHLSYDYEHWRVLHDELRALYAEGKADYCYSSAGLSLNQSIWQCALNRVVESEWYRESEAEHRRDAEKGVGQAEA